MEPHARYGEALRWRRNLWGAIAALLLVAVVATGVLDAATTRHEDRSFAVGPSPRLVIRDGIGGGLRGGIQVHAGTSDRVHVEGKVHATWRVRYVLEQRGDEVLLEVQARPFLGWLSLLGPARFTVTAPADARLQVESLSAPIMVRGITGGGSLETSNGGIHLDGAGGGLAAITTNGEITATRFTGSARLRTTNGEIRVDDSRGVFDVATTNGAVLLDADLDGGARHRAQTTNGRVEVHLHGAPSLRIDARTTNGAVTASLPIAISEQTPSTLIGTVGAGAGELWIRTTNGAVVIE